MSCTSFYQQQARKKVENDPLMRKWYEDAATQPREPRVRRKPKMDARHKEAQTKVCVKCHKEFPKPSHSTASDWERRQYCTRLCRFNSNPDEAMFRLPNLNSRK